LILGSRVRVTTCKISQSLTTIVPTDGLTDRQHYRCNIPRFA